MKKVKFILGSIALVAAIGGVFAFKSLKATSNLFSDDQCTVKIQCSTNDQLAGDCAITTGTVYSIVSSTCTPFTGHRFKATSL